MSLFEDGWRPLISHCVKWWAPQKRCFVHVSVAHGEGSGSTHDLSTRDCCHSFKWNITSATFFHVASLLLCHPIACEISNRKSLFVPFCWHPIQSWAPWVDSNRVHLKHWNGVINTQGGRARYGIYNSDTASSSHLAPYVSALTRLEEPDGERAE